MISFPPVPGWVDVFISTSTLIFRAYDPSDDYWDIISEHTSFSPPAAPWTDNIPGMPEAYQTWLESLPDTSADEYGVEYGHAYDVKLTYEPLEAPDRRNEYTRVTRIYYVYYLPDSAVSRAVGVMPAIIALMLLFLLLLLVVSAGVVAVAGGMVSGSSSASDLRRKKNE